jgi:flagellar assembly factor FliW
MSKTSPIIDGAPPEAHITTMRFGAPESVSVSTADLYAFPEALPGLPDSHRYALVRDDAYAPLCWLQSLDEGPVCLPLLPLDALAVDGYATDVAEALGADAARDVLLVTRFDDAAGAFAVNMLAPIALDDAVATGCQIVLDGLQRSYSLRQHVAWAATTRTFSPLAAALC